MFATITSSIRCPEHNREVGGAPNSPHLRGYAVDIAVHGSRERYLIVEGARKAGFTRIGTANSFVHMDCDPSLDPKVIWTYA